MQPPWATGPRIQLQCLCLDPWLCGLCNLVLSQPPWVHKAGRRKQLLAMITPVGCGLHSLCKFPHSSNSDYKPSSAKQSFSKYKGVGPTKRATNVGSEDLVASFPFCLSLFV